MTQLKINSDFNCQELTPEESKGLNGGHPFLIAGGAILVGLALFNEGFKVGENLGRTLYRATR